MSQSRRGLGEIGAPGTSARSITCTLFARLLATTEQLLLLLEQRLEDLPLAVEVALQDPVVAALAIEIDIGVVRPLEVATRSSVPAPPPLRTRSCAESITFRRSATSSLAAASILRSISRIFGASGPYVWASEMLLRLERGELALRRHHRRVVADERKRVRGVARRIRAAHLVVERFLLLAFRRASR